MHWLFLILAGFFEVAFTSCLGKAKDTSGTEAVLWYIGFAVAGTISMFLLIKALQNIPLGTAYAVWTGIGAVGTVMMSIFVFHDSMTMPKLFFITTLILSIVGLKLVSN
jgi:quaternary ammonium compound-resistance protein SugE